MLKLNTIQTREKLNDVYAVDEPGPGGAYHTYMVCNHDAPIEEASEMPITNLWLIKYQKGPRAIADSQHGVLDTDLLEIVRHRMQCFQAGEYACDYNKKALEHIELALKYLNLRVEDRIERNVLGTYNK